MEIVYTVDVKMKHDGEEFKHVLKMDLSCLNILAFSTSYLPPTNQNFSSQETVSSPVKSSFCVYICPLEQPWNFTSIITSYLPFVQVAWSLDGKHLFVSDQAGLCRILKMKPDCMNMMDVIYQYETNEDILCTKYVFPRETMIVNVAQHAPFYETATAAPPFLKYALTSGNFVCVTTSGRIHVLPIDRSLSPSNYYLAQNQAICAYLCDIFPTDQGFNVVVSEHSEGALVHCFVLQYTSLEPRLSLGCYRTRGFRIPSCYGKLKSLIYFQRQGNDCILTLLTSSSEDLIQLYEFNFEQQEWISVNLINSSHERISSVSLSGNQFFITHDAYEGLFARQILIGFNDGSIACFDKLSLKNRDPCFPMNKSNLDTKNPEYFIQMKHTYAGLCCVGFTQNGNIALLRTIQLIEVSSLPSIVTIFVYLFEQYIYQIDSPCDIWDILCLISNNTLINQIIDQLVLDFEAQDLEFKRFYFIRLKECLYHLHRLACPYTLESAEHLVNLLLYHVLLITRDYLRLFIYEPSNRNFVDATQEILQQPSFTQHIDVKRIKYLGDQIVRTENMTIDPSHYELISFTLMINWISDLLFSFISCLQTQRFPLWLTCQNLLTDPRQLQWLRELMVYIYILQKMNKISASKITSLVLTAQQRAAQSNEQVDIVKDIYHSLSRFTQKLEGQRLNIFDENYLDNWSVLCVEMLQSNVENMFPKAYPYLVPNSSLPQLFIRDRVPLFASHLTEASIKNNNSTDILFDIITLGKMSISPNSSYRRCLRCSNFSRVLTIKPYPLLAYRLNNRCLCGGLFYMYNQTNTISELAK